MTLLLPPRVRPNAQPNPARLGPISGGLAAVAFAASAAYATPPPSADPEPRGADPVAEGDETTTAPAVPSLLPSGFLVFVDPATGRILERPRPEQLEALRAQRLEQAARAGSAEDRQRTLDSLPRFEVPGGFGVNVEGLFLSALVVERAADGSLRVRCADADHDGHDHAEAVPAAPTAPPEH